MGSHQIFTQEEKIRTEVRRGRSRAKRMRKEKRGDEWQRGKEGGGDGEEGGGEEETEERRRKRVEERVEKKETRVFYSLLQKKHRWLFVLMKSILPTETQIFEDFLHRDLLWGMLVERERAREEGEERGKREESME